MPSPSKFVSHGEYIYPAILVSLPLVVRAVTLALRDLKRFQFLHAGAVLSAVCVATVVFGICAIASNGRRNMENMASEQILQVVYLMASLLVVLVARQDKSSILKGPHDTNKQTKQSESDLDECRKSLWFISCLAGVYLQAPLLLANYSLGFPSSAFWSPLLATLVIPQKLRTLVLRNRVMSTLFFIAKGALLVVIAPPVLLVPRIFEIYTSYIVGVYVPLHLLLAVLWLV
jgi:glycosylphosphatidylinositol transamidase